MQIGETIKVRLTSESGTNLLFFQTAYLDVILSPNGSFNMASASIPMRFRNTYITTCVNCLG